MMKVKFIECEKRAEAVKQAMWASKIVKVDGGYKAFESISDYESWKKQK